MIPQSLEQNINYKFKNRELLIEALTHKSYCINEKKKQAHNERLEYLGDAILGFVLAEQLMQLFPQDNEGLLSKKRASLVNQDVLSQKALNLKLDTVLILGPGEKEQESNLKPRILCSAYEAILGAMYLDSDFLNIRNWIQDQFKADISQIKPDLEFERDYKTRLQELTQKLKLGMPEYQLIGTEGPSHNPEFLVGLFLTENGQPVEKFRATGKSKKAAEQSAAQQLMNYLETDHKRKSV
ncbi:MAG: ribonuclease III [Bdellovibrionota bacterium]